MAALPPLPIGVTSRPLPDKYASLLSGAHAVQGAVSAQNSYVGIYNNATDGSVLRIYAVDISVSANTFVYFEWVSGNPGTLYTADGAYGASDPRVYATPGQAIIFSSAVCVGQHLGGLSMFAGTGRTYAPGWPIAVIPPTYAFLLQNRNTNIVIEAAIWWLPVPGPLTPRV